ncbi:MAG: ABC transporter ATP-binding protein, partial [Rhodoferax sp.]|nr:ABC transporter ATP-binding protein [Rhodoferax sp.]
MYSDANLAHTVAIRVKNLHKCFQIYASPGHRLRQFVLPRLRRWFGLPTVNYFREFWALSDISFEVKKGQTVGIIGRNGSGQSTLLQMICGTLHPTLGQIEIQGRVAALLELGSGFNPEFTGRENVYFNASVLGQSHERTHEKFADIEAFADIGDFIDQPVKTYSSGMLVRLAFAVIAHVDADILVIDEALAVGDAFFTQKCMRFLRGFMQHGTVLFVSHDTAAVKSLCSHAIWLDKGIVRKHG